MAATGPRDPHDRDVASRLVRAIRSAMGIADDDSAAAGRQMTEADTVASPRLRAVYILVAAIMLALWGGSLIPAIAGWNDPREDGFSFVPAAWATITLLPLGLFTLAGGISGRGRPAARARQSAVIGAGLLFFILLFEIFRRLSNAMGG